MCRKSGTERMVSSDGETAVALKLKMFIVYNLTEKVGQLMLVGYLCRGVVSGCSHSEMEGVTGTFCTHCQHLHLNQEENFVIPMGVMHC